MRINKYIASSTDYSRRKAEELVLDGRIKVNDKVIKDLAYDVDENVDTVLLDNKEIKRNTNYEYYVLNKPKGYISSVSDEKGRKSVIDLIDTNARIYPVGRLDYETEGLLFLTNDGDLTLKLTHPKNKIIKKYVVVLEGALHDDEVLKLKNGLVIDKRKSKFEDVVILSRNKEKSKVEVSICEGRNRIIRKMFEKIKKKVLLLRRTQIADFKMTGLNRGEYRKLSLKEIKYLKNI